jgi:uncharacterized protein YheU (UPF0270 family)
MDDEAPERTREDEDDESAHVPIPWERLTEDALRGVITEFVTREGTEYGFTDVPLETKIADVRRQIERGEVLILFHARSETVNLVPATSCQSRSDRG